MKRVLAICAPLVLITFALSDAAAQKGTEFPKGVFTAPRGGLAAFLHLNADGSFAFNLDKYELLQGTYSVTKDEIIFTDEGGPAAGKGEFKSGKYKWKYQDGKLTFATVEEKNKGRENWASTGPWVMKPKK